MNGSLLQSTHTPGGEWQAPWVYAELSHNPYMLETTASFIGRSPKINSAIEKFEDRPLVEWVSQVPRIFHDEMNGFDFDFHFTGTDEDFTKVVAAFRNQGISEKDVRIMRKGELEDVGVKRREIADLLEWLDSNRNRSFDYDGFADEHEEVIDASVPYIIIQEESAQLELPFVCVNTVPSVKELAGTELTNTPILLMVSRENRKRVRAELQYLLDRPDIELRQLFFLIHPAMNRDRVVRIISDLGVKHPQVVERPDDVRIQKYLEDYPAMDYVRRSIRVLRSKVAVV